MRPSSGERRTGPSRPQAASAASQRATARSLDVAVSTLNLDRPGRSRTHLAERPGEGARANVASSLQQPVAEGDGKGSPDRVDALVWALTELMIVPAAHWRRPQVRSI